MNDYAFGKYLAQRLSSNAYMLLKSIYDAVIEPKKPLPESARGIIDEIKSWQHNSLSTTELLNSILTHPNYH